MCSHSSCNTDQQESTHLEAAISILDTMEGVAIAETLSCVMVCSECIQLVTEDAVNKKRCGMADLRREAAFNLSLIYHSSGNTPLTQHYLQRYCTV